MSDIQGQVVLAENSAGNGLQRLKLNAGGLLRVVAEATSVSANQIDLNTDGLEGLIASTNTALGTIDGVLDNAEAHLGNIDTGIDVLEACVGSNKVNVNISSGNITGFATATNQSTIIGHIDGVETSLTAITGYVDGLETLQTATNSVLGTIDTDTGNIATSVAACATDLAAIEVINTNAETHLGNIDTGIDVLEACVGSNKVNVNISSGNISGFSTATNQSTIIGHLDGVEGKLDHLSDNLDTLETTLTAIETDMAAIEVINTNAESHLGAIDTGIDVLEACVGSNKVNVNISSGNISGFSTASNQSTIIGHLDGVEGKLDTLETTLTAIETDIGANEVLHTAANALLTTIDSDTDAIKTSTSACATDLAAIEVLHTATNQKLDDIETAVQLIDDAIKTEDLAHSSGDKGIPCLMVRQDSHSDLAADGDYMIPTINANGEIRVTSTAASGGSTEAKQDDLIGHLDGVEGKLDHLSDNLDTLETTLTAIETDIAANEVLHTAANALLTTIDSDTDAIKTSTTAMATDLAALEVLLTTTNSKIDTFDAVLDASLVKQTAMTTDLAALEVLQTTIKNDAMVETIIFNAQINASATGTSSAFERPRNATNWAILIENTSTDNGNHQINLSRSVNNSHYFTPTTDHNSVGDRNNVIEITSSSNLSTNKYYKVIINNQDSSAHTYKVTICA